MKKTITAIFMATAILISTAAMAQKTTDRQNREERQEMMRQRMNRENAKNDFLTQEQKESFKNLRIETEKELKPLKNELRELMARQQTLVTADKADLNAINKNIDKMSDVKAEMAKITAKQHQAIRSQLTEEQLLKFDNRRNKMDRGMKNYDRKKRAEFNSGPMHHTGV